MAGFPPANYALTALEGIRAGALNDVDKSTRIEDNLGVSDLVHDRQKPFR